MGPVAVPAGHVGAAAVVTADRLSDPQLKNANTMPNTTRITKLRRLLLDIQTTS